MKKINTAQPVRIAILEHNTLSREGLSALIGTDAALACVGSYTSAAETIQWFSRDTPEFLIMDIIQPNLSGFDDVKKIKANCPSLQIIILTDSEDNDTISKSFRAGAGGYLLKLNSSIEIFSAIKAACHDGSPITASIAHRIIEMVRDLSQNPLVHSQPFPHLSEQEQIVLNHLATGLLYKEISDQMKISSHTVHSHVSHIYKKLGVQSRTEATAKFLKHQHKSDGGGGR